MLNVLKIYELRRRISLPAPVEEVFSFFSRAENLNLITPEWLYFKILTPLPVKMEKNTLIDYSIKLLGLKMIWKTEITVWEPPHRFIDRQLKGPYRHWEHSHLFERSGKNTQMEDIILYAVPGFVFAPIVHFFFVRPRLKKIFDFREQRICEIFTSREKE